MMRYFMLKKVKNTKCYKVKFLLGKFIVNISPVFIAIILFFSSAIMNVSCKTCKCPAYSMHEMNKTSTTGTSKDGNILFDKSLENAKNGLNRSI